MQCCTTEPSTVAQKGKKSTAQRKTLKFKNTGPLTFSHSSSCVFSSTKTESTASLQYGSIWHFSENHLRVHVAFLSTCQDSTAGPENKKTQEERDLYVLHEWCINIASWLGISVAVAAAVVSHHHAAVLLLLLLFKRLLYFCSLQATVPAQTDQDKLRAVRIV